MVKQHLISFIVANTRTKKRFNAFCTMLELETQNEKKINYKTMEKITKKTHGITGSQAVQILNESLMFFKKDIEYRRAVKMDNVAGVCNAIAYGTESLKLGYVDDIKLRLKLFNIDVAKFICKKYDIEAPTYNYDGITAYFWQRKGPEAYNLRLKVIECYIEHLKDIHHLKA